MKPEPKEEHLRPEGHRFCQKCGKEYGKDYFEGTTCNPYRFPEPKEEKCEHLEEDWNGYHCRCGKENILRGTDQKCALENCPVCYKEVSLEPEETEKVCGNRKWHDSLYCRCPGKFGNSPEPKSIEWESELREILSSEAPDDSVLLNIIIFLKSKLALTRKEGFQQGQKSHREIINSKILHIKAKSESYGRKKAIEEVKKIAEEMKKKHTKNHDIKDRSFREKANSMAYNDGIADLIKRLEEI